MIFPESGVSLPSDGKWKHYESQHHLSCGLSNATFQYRLANKTVVENVLGLCLDGDIVQTIAITHIPGCCCQLQTRYRMLFLTLGPAIVRHLFGKHHLCASTLIMFLINLSVIYNPKFQPDETFCNFLQSLSRTQFTGIFTVYPPTIFNIPVNKQ